MPVWFHSKFVILYEYYFYHLMDQSIRQDKSGLESEYHYSWLNPIISIENNVINPYISDIDSRLSTDPNFLLNPIGNIYAQHENVISFTFDDEDNSNDQSKLQEAKISQFATPNRPSFDPTSPAMIYRLSSSIGFNSPVKLQAPLLSGFLKKNTIRIDKIEWDYSFIEPIMMSAFLYNPFTHTIVSEVWNFYPEQVEDFLRPYFPDIQNNLSATFEVDPSKSTRIKRFEKQRSFSLNRNANSIGSNYRLIIALSHPVSKDKGQSAINFYLNPKDEKALYRFEEEQKKNPITNPPTFSVFGLTYFDYTQCINSETAIQMPSVYLIDHLPSEYNFSSFLTSITFSNSLKKIPMKVSIISCKEESNLIIRQICNRRPEPFLYPVNKISLRIDSLQVPESLYLDSPDSTALPKDIGYFLQFEVLNGETPVPVIQSIFNPAQLVTSQRTNICYPPNPFCLNETYVIDLPYPVTNSHVLQFTLFRVSFEDQTYAIETVGSSKLNIFENGVIVDEKSKMVQFSNQIHLSVRLYLRSNAYTTNSHLNTFLQGDQHVSFDILDNVPPELLTTYLFSILNKLLIRLDLYNDETFVENIIKLSNLIFDAIELKKLLKFYMAFVIYFAFPSPLNFDFAKTGNYSYQDVFNSSTALKESEFRFEEDQVKKSDKSKLDFTQLQLHLKLMHLLTLYISNHKDGIDDLAPYFDFFFALITKFITVNTTAENKFELEFEVFVLGFSAACQQSSKNIASLVRSYALFLNFLFDFDNSKAVCTGITQMFSNWIDAPETRKAKNVFLDTLLRPSLFALLVRNSNEFREIIISFIKEAYETVSKSDEPSKFFDILLRITEKFDKNINESIATALIDAASFMNPKYLIDDTVLSPCIFFLYLVTNSKAPPINEQVFEGLHFLLKRVSNKKALTQHIRNSRTIEAPVFEDTIKKKSRRIGGTFSVKKKAMETPSKTPLLSSAQNKMILDQEETLAQSFKKITHESVYTIIAKMETRDDVPSALLIPLIYHLLSVTKELDLIIKLITILGFYMKKFEMNFINVKSPALVRILLKLLQLAYEIPETALNPFPNQPQQQPDDQERKPFPQLEMPQNKDIHSQYKSLDLDISIPPSPRTSTNDEYASVSVSVNTDHLLKPSEVLPRKATAFSITGNVDEVMNSINLVIAEFLSTLFEVDKKCNPTNNRSCMVLMRSLACLKFSELSSGYIKDLFIKLVSINSEQKNELLQDCIKKYQRIQEITKVIEANNRNRTLTYEKESELLLELFWQFSYSPDAQITILEKLYNHHVKNKSMYEASCVSIMQAAILFENLTVYRRIPNYFILAHPCLVFSEICEFCDQLKVSESFQKDPPFIPGLCDSSTFNEQGFLSLLYRVFTDCEKHKLYNFSTVLLDLCWPIFEYWHSFNELQFMFSNYHTTFSAMVEDSEGQDVFTDRFFRVTLFGDRLGESNGKMFIYRQKPLTHLYDFTNTLVSQYKEMYGNDNVVQISESGKIDTTKLDLVHKIYIQITFVEPYLQDDDDDDVEVEVTNNCYQKFFFETPFVKNEDDNTVNVKSQQASMEKQWIRKTILTTDFKLPSVLLRSEINPSKIVEKDLEPIKVVCQQILDRTVLLEKALESKDAMKMQQLLHGSLLVQVNEGPGKMADVFLSTENNKTVNSRPHDKLREAFVKFMRQIRKGVVFHKELAIQNPEFVPLQEELEAGYDNLKNKLVPLCITHNAKNPSQTVTPDIKSIDSIATVPLHDDGSPLPELPSQIQNSPFEMNQENH